MFLFLLLILFTACGPGMVSGENQDPTFEETPLSTVELSAVWTPTIAGLPAEILVPTYTLTPTATPSIITTHEISPTTNIVPPTPTETRAKVDVLENYVTATPFHGDDVSLGTSLFDLTGCPFKFRYLSDWEIVLRPDAIDFDKCILSFRPGNWLAYIQEAYFDLPEYSGQIIYWETSYHQMEFGFWYEGGEWFIGGDGIMPGEQVPLVKAGENYILRGKIDVRRYSRETDAYAGLQPYLMFIISNSEGQWLSIETVPYEVKEGIELIMRTITFNDAD